jgi:hypothetical protein
VNHQQAWDLIPWLVNDTLESAEREELEQHLADCPHCRGELQAQRALLQAIIAGPRVEAMPRASLQKLWARIDARTAPSASRQPPGPRRRAASSWRIAAAAGVMLLLVASLLFLLLPAQQQQTDEFRTVTDSVAGPAGEGIRAVFAGEMPLQELQSLLERTGLTVVAGPTASGVFTLGPATPAHDAHAALPALRAHPAVRFAEPVGP